MRAQDLEKLNEKLSLWKEQKILSGIKKVIICSAGSDELRDVQRIFSEAEVKSLDLNQWNLDDVCSEQSDLVIASNVFMCAHDPLKWLSNALENTKHLVVIDHVVAYRGGVEGETSPSTGDVMRYTMPPLFNAKLQTAFDLNSVKEKIVDIEPFSYPSFCGVPDFGTTTMFISLFKEPAEISYVIGERKKTKKEVK